MKSHKQGSAVWRDKQGSAVWGVINKGVLYEECHKQGSAVWGVINKGVPREDLVWLVCPGGGS